MAQPCDRRETARAAHLGRSDRADEEQPGTSKTLTIRSLKYETDRYCSMYLLFPCWLISTSPPNNSRSQRKKRRNADTTSWRTYTRLDRSHQLLRVLSSSYLSKKCRALTLSWNNVAWERRRVM